MHVYMRTGGFIRFRCADYPDCRTFFKKPLEANGLSLLAALL
jgi:ssDNA-binding Zn-finger/Zn-ribbon topoisomerase 1